MQKVLLAEIYAPPQGFTGASNVASVCVNLAKHYKKLTVKFQGLDSNAKRDFLLFLQLFLGFSHFPSSILNIGHLNI